MLILFHYIGILIFQILQKRKRQKYFTSIEEKSDSDITTNEDLENSIKFDPPVYRQRYATVFQTLIDERWRTKLTKLCDFGCAEFGLFIFIKRLNRLTDISFVDIDEDLLKENVRRIHPLTIEYLKRREEPLTVTIFAGSVGDPDYRILNTDAITAIELIEHLYPDVLDAFPYNVLSYAEPKLVIVTTPNADFNILFSPDNKRFRHYDHKFEWTREQFQDWANNLVIRYPDYTVTFSGIGEGPEGTDHLGHCSQMALFIRKDLLDEKYMLNKYLIQCFCANNSISNSCVSCNCVCPFCSPKESYGICTYCSYSKHIIDYEIESVEQNPLLNIFYKAVEKIEYPFERDKRTEDEKMIDEFRYRINTFGHINSRFFVEERERAEIPLKDLLYGPDVGLITETELSNLLTKHDYRIEKCVIQETNELETCVIFEPLMDNATSSSDPSDFDSNSGYYQSVNESLSDWDDAEAQKDQKEGEPSSSNKDPSSSDTDTLHDALSEPESPRSVTRNHNTSIPKLAVVAKTFLKRVQNNPIEEQEETDLFEETPSTPSLSSQDNKVHLKRASNIEKTDGQVANGFPNWLLQILGTQVPMSEGPMEGTLEEPHYYCQGDGLGVHPSVVAVEVDDEDENDEDDNSTDSSNNTHTDFAEVDPGISSQDMSSLPEDSPANTTTDMQDPLEEMEDGGGPSVRPNTNFDPGSSSSDTGIGTSGSS